MVNTTTRLYRFGRFCSRLFTSIDLIQLQGVSSYSKPTYRNLSCVQAQLYEYQKAMALLEDQNFKICGLCSQLMMAEDESILISSALRAFLIDFLQGGVTEDMLPIKTCPECYKSSMESKRFRDACVKSIKKLHGSSPMTLEKVKNSGKSLTNTKVTSVSTKKQKILKNLELDAYYEIENEMLAATRSKRGSRGPLRSTRKSEPYHSPPASAVEKTTTQRRGRGASNSSPQSTLNCRVVIRRIDKERADRHLSKTGIFR